MFADVGEIRGDPARTLVYAEGWQSWSPVAIVAATATFPPRAAERDQIMELRPATPPPADAIQAEGLLAIAAPDQPTRLFAAVDLAREIPSIRLRCERGRLVVSADGGVADTSFDGAIDAALRAWADAAAEPPRRAIPAGWCSWYCYGEGVSDADVVANLEAAERLELPIRIVQIDDGWQASVGDWLERSPRFGPLERLAAAVRATARIAGIWIAPFLVGERSRLAAEHSDWLVPELDAGWNWQQRLRVLDLGRREAAAYLEEVLRGLAAAGFRYFKLDFLYAGALRGVDAYRDGLRLIREAVGADALLLGCGAPILPSIGLVDALRIGPDIAPDAAAIRRATASVRARAWMNGRLWINDPDCLLVRAEVEQRAGWAAEVEACGGVVFSSDRLDELDARGLELTRRVLGGSDLR